VSFVSSAQVETAAQAAGLDAAETAAIVESYEDAQLEALEAGLLTAGFIALAALFVTGGLPSRVPPGERDAEDEGDADDEGEDEGDEGEGGADPDDGAVVDAEPRPPGQDV
jgi:hypothetical protein